MNTKTSQKKDWSQPHEITKVQAAFPADALDYMPSREESEAALQAMEPEIRAKWVQFQRDWFFSGLPAATTFNLKDGIDGDKALRHLQAIQGSFAPKHQHKEAAVAYLASLWFDDVYYGTPIKD